jgi:dienelactone hydrolase
MTFVDGSESRRVTCILPLQIRQALLYKFAFGTRGKQREERRKMGSSKVFSTADVPPEFLKPAYLVGNIPFTALESEPRVSYTLYIPERHYSAYACSKFHDNTAGGLSTRKSPMLPLIVNIHGTRRGAERCRDSLTYFAEEMGVAIVAPLFPAGADSIEALHNYKVLRQNDFHADSALLSILNEVRDKWPGIDTEKVFMMGFSGGGQFTHRFMYLYPERLHAVSIGAPGRATRLDETLDWPVGVKNVTEIFDGVRVDVQKIRQLAIQLVCGELDTEVYGGEEFWTWLESVKAKYPEVSGARQLKVSNDAVGKASDRIGGLRRIKGEYEVLGLQCQLDIVPNAKHEKEKMLPAVTRFLRPLIERLREDPATKSSCSM